MKDCSSSLWSPWIIHRHKPVGSHESEEKIRGKKEVMNSKEEGRSTSRFLLFAISGFAKFWVAKETECLEMWWVQKENPVLARERWKAQLRWVEQGTLIPMMEKSLLGGKYHPDSGDVEFLCQWGEQIRPGHTKPRAFVSKPENHAASNMLQVSLLLLSTDVSNEPELGTHGNCMFFWAQVLFHWSKLADWRCCFMAKMDW